MRIFRYISLLMACFALLSCGGGNSDTSGSANISLKIDFDQQTKAAMKNQAKLIVSNTLINSVKIGYGPSGGAVTTVDATSAAENGTEVTLNNILLNKPYTFSISAFGADSVLVCEGSDTATVHRKGVTNINLTCSFKEKYAVENLAYDIVSKITAGTPLDAVALDGLVANSFVVKDGMNRTDYINHLADALNSDARFKFSDVTLLKTEVVEPKTKDASTTTNVRFFFSDGSYYTEPMNFVKEDDTWKITGNGRQLGYKLYPQAIALADAGLINATLFVGYRFQVDDSMAGDYDTFSVTGTGINGASAENAGTYFALSPSTASTSFGDVNNHFIDVAGLEDNSLSIPAGTSYDVTAADSHSNTVTEQSVTSAAGIARSEMNPIMFPSVTASADDGVYTFSVDAPTGYTPSRIELHAYFADTAGGAKTAAKSAIKSVSVDSLISLTDKSFTLDMNELTGGLWTPAYGYVEITAYDENGRAFSTYVSSDCIDYSGTSLSQGSNTVDSSSKLTFGVAAFIKSIYTQYETATGTESVPATTEVDEDGQLKGVASSSVYQNPGYKTVINAFKYDATSGSLYSKQLVINDDNNYGSMNILNDDSGNVYGVGQMYNTSSTDFMLAVVKIDGTTGTLDWAKSYSSPVATSTYVSKAVLSLDGSSIVVLANSGAEVNIFKIATSDGASQGGASYTDLSNTLRCNFMDTVSGSGRYALGCYNQTAPVFMAIDPDLSLAGSVALSSQASNQYLSDMDADGEGNIFFALQDDTNVIVGKIASDMEQTTFTGFSSVNAVVLNNSSSTYTVFGSVHLTRSGDALYAVASSSTSDGFDRVEYVNKLTTDLNQVWSVKLGFTYYYYAQSGSPISEPNANYYLNRVYAAPINSVALSLYGLIVAIPSNGNTAGLNANVSNATSEIGVSNFAATIPAAVVNTSASGFSFTSSALAVTEGVDVKLFMSNYNMWNGDGALSAGIYTLL